MEDMTELLLQAAQSATSKARIRAVCILKDLYKEDASRFLLSMSCELADDAKPPESRWLAANLLKDSLDGKNLIRKNHFVNKWKLFDPFRRSQIKEQLLRTLGSSVLAAGQVSAQIIAKVASIEIPLNQWPELVRSLLYPVNNPTNLEHFRQSSLETLGYVYGELSDRHLSQPEVDSVLTVVVQTMVQPDTNSAQVLLAATKALLNVLPFSQNNFWIENERSFIIKAVCDSARSQNALIRQAAFECLVSIASTYYDILDQYMETLFDLTSYAVTRDEESVAVQAIEFWSSICDEEILRQEFKDCPETGDPSRTLIFHIIKKAHTHLVPMLLNTLDNHQVNEDHWNIAMAGRTCLGLIARIVGDGIVPLVLPFVEENRNELNWQRREAATYAFGSILEGLTVDKLASVVAGGLEFLLSAIEDENDHVRDTTAWTLGRIFEFLPSPDTGFSVISPENLQKIVGVLQDATKDKVLKVAEKACGAIYNLVKGYGRSRASSSLLSPYLITIIRHLDKAAQCTESKVRLVAYETLKAVVECLNLSVAVIELLLPYIIKNLSAATFLKPQSTKDLEIQLELLAFLCGVIRVIIQSSTEEMKPIIEKNADEIMMLFQSVFDFHGSSSNEEAMIGIGALAYATGGGLKKYMPKLIDYLKMGLKNFRMHNFRDTFREYQVRSVTVGVIGDICLALGEENLNEIMCLFHENLQNGAVHRLLKPPIFSAFGDIALAIGVEFVKYSDVALDLMKAAEVCAQMNTLDDKELIDYANQVTKSIFEACSLILLAIKDEKARFWGPYFQFILKQANEFVSKHFISFRDTDDGVTKAAVAAMGELAVMGELAATGELADVEGNKKWDIPLGTFALCSAFVKKCLLESDDKELNVTAGCTQGRITRLELGWSYCTGTNKRSRLK